MKVNGKKYEVIEILERPPYSEKDLFVCMSEYGYKECFQRFDIEHQKPLPPEYPRAWTSKEENYIRQKLQNSETMADIKNNFVNPNRSDTAIEHMVYRIKKELGL